MSELYANILNRATSIVHGYNSWEIFLKLMKEIGIVGWNKKQMLDLYNESIKQQTDQFVNSYKNRGVKLPINRITQFILHKIDDAIQDDENTDKIAEYIEKYEKKQFGEGMRRKKRKTTVHKKKTGMKKRRASGAVLRRRKTQGFTMPRRLTGLALHRKVYSAGNNGRLGMRTNPWMYFLSITKGIDFQKRKRFYNAHIKNNIKTTKKVLANKGRTLTSSVMETLIRELILTIGIDFQKRKRFLKGINTK
jgi:hypothetical protein